MEIQHQSEKTVVGSHTDENPGILLTNRKGSYLYLTAYPFSSYSGLFTLQGDNVFKSIESLGPKEKMVKVVNRFNAVERVYESGDSETITFPHGRQGLLYERRGESPTVLTFDCRKGYDARKWGKFYSIYEKDGCIVVEFQKRKNPQEDMCQEELEYTLYTVIRAETAQFHPWNNWIRKETPYDARRGEQREEYVFEALSCTAKRAAIVSGTDLVKNIEEANSLFERFDEIKKNEETHSREIVASQNIPNKEVELAYKCALASMDALMCTSYGTEGLYAGLPWFNQYWTRDEGISAKALMIAGRYQEAKALLMKNLKRVFDDGCIPSRTPDSELRSADGVGWIFRRFDDFITLLQQSGKEDILKEEELLYVQKMLLLSIKRRESSYATKEGLIRNNEKETWMDTTWNNEDKRDGIRIEIQALHLAMYRLLKKIWELQKDKKEEQKAAAKELALVRQVRKVFWNKRLLADGFYDFTIRPNAFMALYIYPDLLTLNQKRSFAKNAVEKLWLEWGGFSTIQKDHPLFTDDHTGINNRSYHRGDSWFYLNNMIALLLFEIDRTRYKEEIRKVLAASTQEILYKGMIGHHAELSPAKRLESVGCHCQAWSAAMYIELVKAMFMDV